MRVVMSILLGLIIAYGLFLVFANSQPVMVNLLFSTVPQMALGLMLILTLLLGLLAGILMSLMMFRVFQIRAENQRLLRDLASAQQKLVETQSNYEQHLNQSRNAGIPLSVNNPTV